MARAERTDEEVQDIACLLWFLYGCIDDKVGMRQGRRPHEAFESACRLVGVDPYAMMCEMDAQWDAERREP